jgi:hypothetical protein
VAVVELKNFERGFASRISWGGLVCSAAIWIRSLLILFAAHHWSDQKPVAMEKGGWRPSA